MSRVAFSNLPKREVNYFRALVWSVVKSEDGKAWNALLTWCEAEIERLRERKRQIERMAIDSETPK